MIQPIMLETIELRRRFFIWEACNAVGGLRKAGMQSARPLKEIGRLHSQGDLFSLQASRNEDCVGKLGFNRTSALRQVVTCN